jgi:tryptophan synthase beta subunit
LNNLKFKSDDVVVVNLSGRGDKDMLEYSKAISRNVYHGINEEIALTYY